LASTASGATSFASGLPAVALVVQPLVPSGEISLLIDQW
jgi:hypothetical protein